MGSFLLILNHFSFLYISHLLRVSFRCTFFSEEDSQSNSQGLNVGDADGKVCVAQSCSRS